MSAEITYDDIHDLLPGYVLGALEPDEMLRMEAFIEAHPEVDALVAEAEAAMTQMAYLAPDAALPADAKQRLIQRAQNATVVLAPQSAAQTPVQSARPHAVQPEPWGEHFKNLFPVMRWGVAFAVLAGLLVWNLRLQDAITNITTIDQAIGAENARVSLIIDTPAAPNATGKLYLPTGSTTGVIAVTGLPQLPPGKDYQFWFARPDKSRDSAAIFDVGPNGDALIPVTIPNMLAQYDQIWITQEPDGGSAVPTAPHYMEGPLIQ